MATSGKYLQCKQWHGMTIAHRVITRCLIVRHRTVSAQHRTLLAYEGNKSHVIKNMAAAVK